MLLFTKRQTEMLVFFSSIHLLGCSARVLPSVLRIIRPCKKIKLQRKYGMSEVSPCRYQRKILTKTTLSKQYCQASQINSIKIKQFFSMGFGVSFDPLSIMTLPCPSMLEQFESHAVRPDKGRPTAPCDTDASVG